MVSVLLFHRALGLTSDIQAFAGGFRLAGHEVLVPDLFDGRIFAILEEGVAYISEIGFDAVRGALSNLPMNCPLA